MQDHQIISLYWQRDETAIRETEKKYGRYLIKIAYNILSDWADCEESVNDTYLRAWNSIPPQRPDSLPAYLAKITRGLSIDICRKRTRRKRRASENDLSLSELESCLSAGDTTQQAFDANQLARAISAFLRTLPADARDTFIGRYYFSDPVRDIAAYCGMSESKTKSMLRRTRLGLRAYLEKEGFLSLPQCERQ